MSKLQNWASNPAESSCNRPRPWNFKGTSGRQDAGHYSIQDGRCYHLLWNAPVSMIGPVFPTEELVHLSGLPLNV